MLCYTMLCCARLHCAAVLYVREVSCKLHIVGPCHAELYVVELLSVCVVESVCVLLRACVCLYWFLMK